MNESNNLTNNQEEIEKLKKELEEQKDRLLRVMADFDNFKKRAAAEREEIICFAGETFIAAILPILDNFDRAFASDHKQSPDEFLKGMALIRRQLEDTLEKMGVKSIECVGKPFDPFLHHAIMTRESDQPENTVLEETQKGYTLHGKVIRPAMVIVSKKSENPNKE